MKNNSKDNGHSMQVKDLRPRFSLCRVVRDSLNSLRQPLKVVLSTATLLAVSQSASAVTLNFEGFSAGTIIDNEYAPGVTVSTNNLGGGPNHSVIFNTNNFTGGDDDLESPFSGPYINPGQVLIIQENDPCDEFTCDVPDDEGSRVAGDIFFVFNTGVTLQSLKVFDIDSPETQGSIDIFSDAAGTNLLGMFSIPVVGDHGSGLIDFGNLEGVQSMVVHMGGSGAIDDLEYSVVPVPAAVWLFGSGLIGLIGIARRK